MAAPEVRPVTLADIPGIQACVPADVADSIPGSVERIIGRDDAVGYVWDDGEIHGWACAGWAAEPVRLPEGWWCLYTATRPASQASGVSAQLMVARLEWLLERGAETVYASYPAWSAGPAFRWGFMPVPSSTWMMNGTPGIEAGWVLWEASPPVL